MRQLTTVHWDAAYKAIAEHPALSKNTRCAVWIETIGEAVLSAAPPISDDELALQLADVIYKDAVEDSKQHDGSVFMTAAWAVVEHLKKMGVLNANPSPASAPDAMRVVLDAMRSDPEYAWSWHCNIAMAFVDEGGDHAMANHAAARFMRSLAGVDPAHELPAHPAPLAVPADEVQEFSCHRCPVSVESRWQPPDCPECGDPCAIVTKRPCHD